MAARLAPRPLPFSRYTHASLVRRGARRRVSSYVCTVFRPRFALFGGSPPELGFPSPAEIAASSSRGASASAASAGASASPAPPSVPTPPSRASPPTSCVAGPPARCRRVAGASLCAFSSSAPVCSLSAVQASDPLAPLSSPASSPAPRPRFRLTGARCAGCFLCACRCAVLCAERKTTSFNTSCHAAGALLTTFKPDEQGITVGKKKETLNSKGTYIYIMKRQGSNGVVEIAARKLKHTPELLSMVCARSTA